MTRPRIFTRPELDAFALFNFGVNRAKDEYAAHPTTAREEDWCQACDYPRNQERCHVCVNAMSKRRKRGAA